MDPLFEELHEEIRINLERKVGDEVGIKYFFRLNEPTSSQEDFLKMMAFIGLTKGKVILKMAIPLACIFGHFLTSITYPQDPAHKNHLNKRFHPSLVP